MIRLLESASTRIAALVLLTVAVLASTAGTEVPVSVAAFKLLSQIRSRGPAKVVQELYSPGGRWASVMAKIREGDSGWLQVAVELRPGTDGGASEELDEAVFLALGPAPEAVLRLLKRHKFSVEVVCSSNIAVDYSAEQSRRFIEERIKALSGVSDPSLGDTRAACERGLRSGLKDLGRPGADD